MRVALVVGVVGIAAAAAWAMSQSGAEDIQAAEADPAPEDFGQGAAQFIDTWTGGVLKLSAMRQVTAADVRNVNVRALLAVIRRGEGTTGPNGYRTMFGGELFEGYADHPRIAVTRVYSGRKLTSTAAGAYQALASSWDETAGIMKLPDFSPASQDLFAVGRIAARGALDDAKAGRFDMAVQKIAREWASMPGSPYGQPVISLSAAQAVYSGAGGVFA